MGDDTAGLSGGIDETNKIGRGIYNDNLVTVTAATRAYAPSRTKAIPSALGFPDHGRHGVAAVSMTATLPSSSSSRTRTLRQVTWWHAMESRTQQPHIDGANKMAVRVHQGDSIAVREVT